MKKNQKLLDQYVNEILAKYNLPAIAACVVNKTWKGNAIPVLVCMLTHNTDYSTVLAVY